LQASHLWLACFVSARGPTPEVALVLRAFDLSQFNKALDVLLDPTLVS